MQKTIRLLVPKKRGVGKRIADAVEAAHGQVVHTRIAQPMRGITVTEILVSCSDASAAEAVVRSLEHLPAITVVGVEDVAESHPSPVASPPHKSS